MLIYAEMLFGDMIIRLLPGTCSGIAEGGGFIYIDTEPQRRQQLKTSPLSVFSISLRILYLNMFWALFILGDLFFLSFLLWLLFDLSSVLCLDYPLDDMLTLACCIALDFGTASKPFLNPKLSPESNYFLES